MTDAEFKAKVDEYLRLTIIDRPADAQYSTASERDGADAEVCMAIHMRHALGLNVVDQPKTTEEAEAELAKWATP